jgi:hypothetical protein
MLDIWPTARDFEPVMEKDLLNKRIKMIRAFCKTREPFWTAQTKEHNANPEGEHGEVDRYLFFDSLLIAALEAGWIEYDAQANSLNWIRPVTPSILCP